MKNSQKNPIGAWYLHLRMNQDMTPAQIRKELGVSRQALHNWLQGSTKPRPKNLKKILAMSQGSLTIEMLLPYLIGDE